MRLIRGLGVRLTVVLLVAAIACAAAPAGDGPGLPIARGVRAGELVLTGLTTQPARELLRAELSRPLSFTIDGRTSQARSGRFLVSADIDGAVRRALAARPGDAVSLRVELRSRAVRAYVGELDRRYSRQPRDAELVGLDGLLRPQFAPGVPGRRVDRAALGRAIRNRLATGGRETIELPFRPVPPAVSAQDFGPVVVIRRASNTLTLYDGRKLVKVFRVATGQAVYPTPLGRFAIVDKQYNPWWYPPASDWARGLKPVPPGPGNPLGTRWMGLSAWGVGIHGTPDAASIGYSASHGCVRMYVPEAEWLFEHVAIGTPVFVVAT